MSDAPTDAELVVRAQRGELDAYTELVQRHQQLAIRVAYMVTRNQADAEDVAQEALLKAYSALAQVDPNAFRAWLLRIVVNQARNHLKAARRRTALAERSATDRPGALTAPSAETSVLASQQRVVLMRALDELREEDRLAIGYRYFFDLSESEMVEALGWPRGTVKSRLSRALGRYRQALGDLAVLPVGTFAFSSVAHELTGWSEAELASGLSKLGSQLLPGPTRDINPGLVHQVQAFGIHPGSPGSSLLTSPQAAALAGGLVCALVAAALFVRPSRPTAPAAPPPTAAPPVLAAPAPPSPSPFAVVVYGGDLSAAQQREVGQALGVSEADPSQTVSRAETVSTLVNAGLSAAPGDAALSSAAVTCQPGGSSGLKVHTDHIDGLAPVTYATALLVAGVRDASVKLAGPSDQTVSGEAALVGMLRVLPGCMDAQAGSGPDSAAALRLVLLTEQIADQTDTSTAGTIMANTVHAIVTGTADDPASIQAALTSAAGDAGQSLDSALVASVADGLKPLVAQDYGIYARGYRIDESPADARLGP
ncbi:MAG: DUF1002 domain-containing protein [Chloroflexi bacterium]|nr:DUF1002 domain-containing protein [Chloroflexota bacterium]